MKIKLGVIKGDPDRRKHVLRHTEIKLKSSMDGRKNKQKK